LLSGQFVNLFDPALAVVQDCTLQPGERALLYDVEWLRRNGPRAKVLGASTRVRNEKCSGRCFTFTTRGPVGTKANMRVLLPRRSARILTAPATEGIEEWDEASGTLWLSLQNKACDMEVTIELAND